MEFQEIIEYLEDLEWDGVPKNIKKELQLVLEYLKQEDLEVMTRVHKALSILDELANDPNILADTRAQLWNISSLLESVSS